jgi:hypothetical protein
MPANDDTVSAAAAKTIRAMLHLVPDCQRNAAIAAATAPDNTTPEAAIQSQHDDDSFAASAAYVLIRDISNHNSATEAGSLLFGQLQNVPGSGRLIDYIGPAIRAAKPATPR